MDLSVKRGPDGVWFARPYLGTNAVTKKPLRPYKRFPMAKTETEALAAAEEWFSTIDKAALLKVSAKLDQLLYRYIDRLEAENVPVNTIKTYRSLVRCYVTPHMENVDVIDVKPYMITALYNVCLLRGARDGSGISPNTVIKLHWFLCGAWKWFVTEELTPYNPMLSVKHPQKVDSVAMAFNEVEFDVLSTALEQIIHSPAETGEEILARNYAFATYLALWQAEREGEICAQLRSEAQLWRQNMIVRATAVESGGAVRRQEKTKGKRIRNVSISDEVCKEIEAHFAWQDATYLKHSSPSTPICTDAKGGMLRPSKLSAWFRGFADDLGLPKSCHFHTLRHTHATWMLLGGANLKDVMERLGHASERTTLGLYVHMMPGRDREAVRIFTETVHAARGGGAFGR